MKFENVFNEEEIQILADIESRRRQFYRPIYSLHKYWARRPGTTFRAILLSLFLQDNVFQGSRVEQKPYYQNHDFNDKIILDPFMGGGTTLVEANRLGIKSIGIDLNPLSYWVTKKELDCWNETLFLKTWENLEQQIAKEIKGYYKTKCPHCDDLSDIMYTFWVRTISCPGCSKKQGLYKYYIIGKKTRKSNEIFLSCPNCTALLITKNDLNKKVKCDKCEYQFIPAKGNAKKKIFTCLYCNYTNKMSNITIEAFANFKPKQIAIEHYCESCGIREYKEIEAYDRKLYSKAQEKWLEVKEELFFPNEDVIMKNKSGNNLLNFGFHSYQDLFNERQKCCLAIIFDEIKKISDTNIFEYFLTAFTSSLEFHTNLNPYNYTMKQIVNLFNYQTFLVPTMFVENNVWGIKKGNGSFRTYIKKIINAKNYCNKPFEVYISNSGSKKRLFVEQEKILGNFAESFEDLINKKGKNILIQQSDSTNLKSLIPNNSIDAIITDPPYGEWIDYLDLSNFFLPWLTEVLQSRYKNFSLPKKKSNETTFKDIIEEVFKECKRVLKRNAPLIFTFHHSNPKTWKTLIQALLLHSFKITEIFLLSSEFPSRPIKASNLDSLIVCRENSQIESSASIKIKNKIDAIFNEKNNMFQNMNKEEKDLRVLFEGFKLLTCFSFTIESEFSELFDYIYDKLT